MARHARFPACTFLAGVFLVGACSSGSKSGTSVTRTDSAGVAIVVNHGSDRPLHWSFTPVLALGGKESGPEAFYHVYPRYVVTDQRGNIYLLDNDNHRVVAFDSAGHSLWMTGHEGKGPGEFSYPSEILLESDSGLLRVFDPGNAVIDVFGLDGAFVRADPTSRTFNARLAYVGAALAVETNRYSAGDRLVLVRAGDSTILATTPPVATTMIKFPNCPISLRMSPIFAPALNWATRKDRLVVNDSVPFTVAVYRGDTLILSIRRALEPTPATAELAGMHFPNGFRVSAGAMKCRMSGTKAAELMGFAPTIPFVADLAIAPDGGLWVHRNVTTDRRTPTDVFDSTGAYLGSLPDSTPWPYAFMPNGDVVSAKSDTTTGVTKLVVYRVTR